MPHLPLCPHLPGCRAVPCLGLQLYKEERKRQEAAVQEVLKSAQVLCSTLTGVLHPSLKVCGGGEGGERPGNQGSGIGRVEPGTWNQFPETWNFEPSRNLEPGPCTHHHFSSYAYCICFRRKVGISVSSSNGVMNALDAKARC